MESANIAVDARSKFSDELTPEKDVQSEIDRVGASLALLEISPVVDSGSSSGGVADVAAVDGGSSRRKLIILDVNGLLGDVVRRRVPGGASFSGGTSEIIKRPFCDDFLRFCFDKFDVGIWSSRLKKNLDPIVDYLLGDQKKKLLFCWNMSNCTQTGFKTPENKHKPLVLKELRKIWENEFPNLQWFVKGYYNESNTLLLDDSPYKALLNPVHSSIFPETFKLMNKNDKALGPGGDLRVYLECLADAEDVRGYVEEHPFGQKAIDETSSNWNFYSQVLGSLP
ncbi:PREDICTED: uncharacterized FCP1 homology domain-containing protein C1271.03c-like isoform X1 [Ipomoea nil]|uniref:uncharacterized FCP1 homology domain-containing protein C1271.03c-like isoform X1 n=1 Tax=Ipomoea nil TaxID=35883 RepID=UPI0009008979|nr:PREDICTED: uncharacterized FCP1 homology domain-containing protein C1271.03c-like isoform X1 [Ipomoea nil]